MNPILPLFAVSLLLASACADSSLQKRGQSSLKTVAFSRWNKKTIEVCWEFTSKSTQSFRNEVERQVGRAFDGATIKFIGWQKCSTGTSSDVKLFVYDDAGSIWDREFRTYLNALIEENGSKKQGAGHPRLRDLNRPMRLVVNQNFKDVEVEFVKLHRELSPQGKRNIALSAAIHELGHALGLRHEDAHPERSCDSFAEEPGDMPGEFQVVSPYNPFSFMSRCHYRAFNYNLSVVYPNAKDIEGINILYADARD